jgi:hypothetical protein
MLHASGKKCKSGLVHRAGLNKSGKNIVHLRMNGTTDAIRPVNTTTIRKRLYLTL